MITTSTSKFLSATFAVVMLLLFACGSEDERRSRIADSLRNDSLRTDSVLRYASYRDSLIADSIARIPPRLMDSGGIPKHYILMDSAYGNLNLDPGH